MTTIEFLQELLRQAETGKIDQHAAPYIQDAIDELETAHSPCHWNETDDGDWCTLCGEMWTFDAGTPWENSVEFCAKCGHPVVFHPYEPCKDGEE